MHIVRWSVILIISKFISRHAARRWRWNRWTSQAGWCTSAACRTTRRRARSSSSDSHLAGWRTSSFPGWKIRWQLFEKLQIDHFVELQFSILLSSICGKFGNVHGAYVDSGLNLFSCSQRSGSPWNGRRWHRTGDGDLLHRTASADPPAHRLSSVLESRSPQDREHHAGSSVSCRLSAGFYYN